MKKGITMLSFLLLFLASCSSDSDDNTALSSGPLLRSLGYIDDNGVYQVTGTFQYNGYKLLRYTDSGTNAQFTYLGDNISQVEYFYPGGEVTYAKRKFQYTASGKLSVAIVDDPSTATLKYIYFYNNDNTIDVNVYSGNAAQQDLPVFDFKMYMQGGEIIKIVKSFNQDIYVGYEDIVEEFTYDSHKKATANILGFNKIYWQQFQGGPGSGGILHNLKTAVYTSYSPPQVTSNLSYPEYNTEDYPTKCLNESDSDFPYTVEYHYE